MQSLSMGDRLGRWRHCRLSLRCEACNWSTEPLVGLLAAQLAPCTTVAEAIARLACQACGTRLVALGLIEPASIPLPA